MSQPPSVRTREWFVNRVASAALAIASLAGLSAPLMQGQAKAKATHTMAPADRAAHAFDTARGNPLELRAFLVRMPKGADLHMHLSGAVYAESWIRAGAEDNLCVDVAALAFTKIDSMRGNPPQPVCGEGKVPATQVFKDQ